MSLYYLYVDFGNKQHMHLHLTKKMTQELVWDCRAPIPTPGWREWHHWRTSGYGHVDLYAAMPFADLRGKQPADPPKLFLHCRAQIACYIVQSAYRQVFSDFPGPIWSWKFNFRKELHGILHQSDWTPSSKQNKNGTLKTRPWFHIYIYFRNWISRCWNFGVQLVVWRYSQKSNVDIRWWICENIQKNSQPLLHFARKCWCNTCPKLKLSTQLLPGQSSGGDVQWWWGQGKSDGNVGVYIYRYVLAWLVTHAEGSSTLQPAIFVAHSHLILCSIGVHSKAFKSLQPGEQTHNHL